MFRPPSATSTSPRAGASGLPISTVTFSAPSAISRCRDRRSSGQARANVAAWLQSSRTPCRGEFSGHNVRTLSETDCRALPSKNPHPSPLRWLNNQPYLLLSLTSLLWAGNIVLARYVAGHVPPMTLSCVRWIGAFFMLLPFAWPYLKRDWPALRAKLPLMVMLSATGFAINNALSYWALQYTQALNALLIQSGGPLFVALWSLVLFGVRLTRAQLAGIAISLAGVLTIILRGDLGALASIQFNKGDVMFAAALLSLGLYSALIPRRPKTHQLSLIAFTTGCGALLLLPCSIWEFSTVFTLT